MKTRSPCSDSAHIWSAPYYRFGWSRRSRLVFVSAWVWEVLWLGGVFGGWTWRCLQSRLILSSRVSRREWRGCVLLFWWFLPDLCWRVRGCWWVCWGQWRLWRGLYQQARVIHVRLSLWLRAGGGQSCVCRHQWGKYCFWLVECLTNLSLVDTILYWSLIGCFSVWATMVMDRVKISVSTWMDPTTAAATVSRGASSLMMVTPVLSWTCVPRTMQVSHSWSRLVETNDSHLWLVDTNNTHLWLVVSNNTHLWLVDTQGVLMVATVPRVEHTALVPRVGSWVRTGELVRI